MTTQAWLWSTAGVSAAIAAFAVFAEHRRSRRRDLDKVGWVPWNFIQILGFMGTIVFAVLALKSG